MCTFCFISIHNFTAKVTLRRYDHVTYVLAIFHWLHLPELANFKLALMAYRMQHGMAPGIFESARSCMQT